MTAVTTYVLLAYEAKQNGTIFEYTSYMRASILIKCDFEAIKKSFISLSRTLHNQLLASLDFSKI